MHQALATTLLKYSSCQPCRVAHPTDKEGRPAGKYHSKMKSGLQFFALVHMVLRGSKAFGEAPQLPRDHSPAAQSCKRGLLIGSGRVGWGVG